jgi:hypothetical protein
MMFIDELRRCDPGAFIRAPTLNEEENRKWVATPIGQFLNEYDRLARECVYQKQQADFWRRMATGVTPLFSTLWGVIQK